MSEKTVWVAFDLGFKADFEGIYSWLDKNGAKECCDHLAVLKYDSDNDILDEIEKDVKLHVKLNDTDRIYLVYKDEDTGKVKGRFINGGRRRAPWQGYAVNDSQIEDE